MIIKMKTVNKKHKLFRAFYNYLLFFLLVAVLAALQLGLTRSREVDA